MYLETRFLLNEREVCTTAPHGMVVLDFLRRKQRLTGTKEGCREGDCGACTVLIGELNGDQIVYKPVASCLVPLGELHGRHLVTIEGLNMPDLSPVQQAIVNEGATQCGFCTPGIVVSLTGYVMEDHQQITRDGIKTSLGGHLCRCTGYRSLKHTFHFLKETVKNHTGIETLAAKRMIPGYFLEIPAKLRKIPVRYVNTSAQIPEYFVAGGTDLYVQKGDILPESRIHLLSSHPEMKEITKKNETLRIGAYTTFEEFSRHPEVINVIPRIQEYMSFIASLQIRNRATLGGNIINASPIADLTILLLALESTVVLKNDNTTRFVPMTSFFKGYKLIDKLPSEILTEVLVPIPSSETKIDWEKVSKRKYLDVASVNSAIKIRCRDGIIQEMGLAMGGVAPIPFFLNETAKYFSGKRISKETIEGSFSIVQKEISPIDDIRGSSKYKRLLARQLLIAHFAKLFPEIVKVKDFYETY